MDCSTLVILLAVLMSGSLRAETHISTGTSGHSCSGDRNRKCPEVCRDDHCTCEDRNLKGVPALLCAPSDYSICGVTGDPKVRNFEGERIEYPVPCQYALTGGTVYVYDDNGDRTGAYYFEVTAYNKRVDSKVYPGGFQFNAVRSIGATTHRLSFKVEGHAASGKYNYTSQASTDWGVTWLDWQGKDGNSGLDLDSYQFDYDDDTNRIFFSYPELSLLVAFRAVDDALPRTEQQYLSGIAVGFKPTDDMLHNPNTLCLQPGERASDVVNSEMTVTAGYLYNTVQELTLPQVFPGGSSQCAKMSDALKQCEGEELINEAMNVCTELFEKTAFVGCVSAAFPDGDRGSGDTVVQLFNNCLDTLCGDLYNSCQDMQNKIHPACSGSAPVVIKDFDCENLLE